MILVGDGANRQPIRRTSRIVPYTAPFSNTARAHVRGKTHDWVILYYDHDGGESQCTVITAERGPLKGKRIVRGRD